MDFELCQISFFVKLNASTHGYDTFLYFKRTTNIKIFKLSPKPALIIQVLKALGKEIINSIVVSKLQSGTDETEQKTVLTETKFATSWIYEVIKTICK